MGARLTLVPRLSDSVACCVIRSKNAAVMSCRCGILECKMDKRLGWQICDLTTAPLLSLNASAGGRVLVQGLTFSLGPSERILIVGESGAGKSSLLRTMAGLWTTGEPESFPHTFVVILTAGVSTTSLLECTNPTLSGSVLAAR